MSQDVINDLPTELLYEIFGHLPFQDQLTAMTACTQWNDILSDNRFTVHHTVDLGSYIRRGGDLNTLKSIRSYKVAQILSDEAEQIERFLRCEEVSERVEELHLDKSCEKLGVCGESTLCLPKLKKLWLREWFKKMDTIVAPVPGHVVLLGKSIPKVSNDEAFKDLQCLEIENTALSIGCPDSVHLGWSRVENLQKLHVRGFGIWFHCLENLPQLRELYLTHDIKSLDIANFENLDAADIIPISMPHLVKLTTQWTGTRLLRTPKLRVLSIIGSNSDRRCSSQVSKYLSTLHQLTALRLVQVNLSESCVNELCNDFPNLMILELDRVLVRHSHVDSILTARSNRKLIKRAAFKNCYFGKQDTNQMFYGSLARRYPNCVVLRES